MGIDKICYNTINTTKPVIKKNFIQKIFIRTTGSDKPAEMLKNTYDMYASKRKAMLEWMPGDELIINSKNEATAQKERELIIDAIRHNIPLDRAKKGARAITEATGELSGKSAKESAIVFDTLFENGILHE